MPSTLLVPPQLLYFNVKDYGAIGDGSTNDATAVQAALTAAAAAKGIMFVPPGTYKITGGVSLTSATDVQVLGVGASSIFTGAAGDTLFTFTTCTRVRMSGVQLQGSTIGLYLNGAGDSHVSDIYVTGSTTAGIKINGDNAMEIHLTDVVCRDVPGNGIQYNKTSVTDTGGLYLDRVRCLYVASGTHGYVFTSTIANSAGYIFMSNCVADGYPGDSCQFNNIFETNITGSFFGTRSTAATATAPLHITGGYNHTLTGNYTYQGSSSNTAFSVLLDGATHEVLIANHVFDGAGTNTGLGLASFGSALRLASYHCYLATFVDTPTKVTSLAGTTIQSPFQMYTDGSGGGSDCFTMTDSSSTTTKKYIRNSGGNLQVLNSAFSAAIFAIADSGDVTVTGRVSAARFASTVATITYSASMTPDSSLGVYQKITVTNATAMTINAPTNVATGAELVVDILNSSGGAMGVITWNAAFKMAGAFTNPATTKRRTISFYYDGTSWIELNRAAADI